ncbi:MAG TPA: DUF1990 domain-containing protein [Candidatus Limnocylindrales bacterium]|nr:DUF1990 domain-containing protein [Candidatus Limnocylindrales bacterium]HZM11738.1 DUF1990 domain-containing protein [Candidatus Limnocylindrales bacterium]
MLFFSEPSEKQINRFLERASSLEFFYSELGATNSAMLPPLFTVDRNRIQLGSGSLAWHRSIDALRKWEMFNMPWVRLCWPTAPIAERSNVAVLAHRIGLFWLNACRIVYLIDEDGPTKRFGFAYGTLTEHAESGEERFLVEWNRETDAVSYDLLAFSRPNQFLSRVGYPVARRLQKQFAADSKAAMVRAVAV